jgi:uncharacterized protein YyaL (SSP411 family)
VEWYPWCDEAFLRAKEEHKPVIVSIGYSACHWCHVMEKESFEDEDVAAYMNGHFVCIKVDREEHPDVDHLYMDAVQAIGGSGGWPLNVFVTPERAPFYGGTYYPPRPAYNRPSWMQLLQRMTEIWQNRQAEVAQQAEQMIAHLKQASQNVFTAKHTEAGKDTCRQIADNLLKQADKEHGGFGNAPKFPGTMAISFLLEHYHFTGYEPALKHALRSLDAMIEGGIYDQLAGVFARYATDRNWLAPHFEKMLYDNALLVSALCDAYSITKDNKYKVVIEETIAFADRELKDGQGGYYCALDADSGGEEGKFYTWTWDEWIEALEGNDPVAAAYFGVRPEGNWEATNILHVAKHPVDIGQENSVALNEVLERTGNAKHKLREARKKRERPATDDKCLLSWNALMNIALGKAGVALQPLPGGEHDYIGKASDHMVWMLEQFMVDGSLQHTWKNGIARIPAKLDDYAYLVQALLQLAAASGENKWAAKAVELINIVVENYGYEAGFFYYTPEQQADIPVRKVELYDGATPSGNAVMAHNLWICGMCAGRSEWMGQAVKMIRDMSDMALRYSYSYGYWAMLLQRNIMGMKTIICTGKDANGQKREMQSIFMPQAFLLSLEKEISDLPVFENKFFADKMCIFVCTEQECLSPVSSVQQALHLIENK